MTKQTQKPHSGQMNAVDQIVAEADELNTFYLDFGGDTRVTERIDPRDSATDRIALKATTLAEAKLEALELVRKNPHLRHLEIFQGDEKISSCDRQKGRDWSAWKEHSRPVELDDQPFENDYERLESLAREECNKAAALIDIKTDEPERYRKKSILFAKSETLNPAHKEWRQRQASLQSQMHDARDTFNAEHTRFMREKDPRINDDAGDSNIIPLVEKQSEEQRDKARPGLSPLRKNADADMPDDKPKMRMGG